MFLNEELGSLKINISACIQHLKNNDTHILTVVNTSSTNTHFITATHECKLFYVLGDKLCTVQLCVFSGLVLHYKIPCL
jgi:hypothetical protein